MSDNTHETEILTEETQEDVLVSEDAAASTTEAVTAETTADALEDFVFSDNMDKVEEYFKMKDVVRTLRNDLKDIKLQMPEAEELDKLQKRVKELREKVKDDENIKTLTEKMQVTKERMDLLKELIRIELLETAREEVKKNGRKLKIINILREMKDEDERKKKGKPFFRN